MVGNRLSPLRVGFLCQINSFKSIFRPSKQRLVGIIIPTRSLDSDFVKKCDADSDQELLFKHTYF